jgi:signal transduction histidine kinase
MKKNQAIFDVDRELPTKADLVQMGRRARLGGLRVKLIGPYLLLTLVVSLIGMFIITRLVTSSIRERFVNQLLEASRVAADSIVRQEQFHLEQLRQMAFTRGVPQATLEGDWEQLQRLLHPMALNNGLQLVTVADSSGSELLSLIRNPGTDDYLLNRDSDLSAFELVQWTLQATTDERGDKFADLVEAAQGEYLVTSAPILLEDRVVGVLLAGTRLESLLSEIKHMALADLVFLNEEGRTLLTTLPPTEAGFDVLNLSSADLSLPELSEIREFELYMREYQIHYSPMVVRSNPIGSLGVVLPSNFIVTTESTSRNIFSLLFAIGTMGVIIMGYLLSRRISRPILRIRDVSLAVAAGDLNQRTGVRGADEVGQMGAVFDLMTSRLRKRTAQVVKLYNEALERSEDLHRANTRLQQAQQKLVQSEKLASVGQLTAGIVHDVKTPLAVIRGLSEEAQEELDPAFIQESLATIREQSTRANTIVTDLLKFARQSNPEKRYQDICDTVQAAVRLTDFLARKGQVTIKIKATRKHIYTTYDAQLMEQVFVNLIQNAIQAMPGGGMLEILVGENEQYVGVAVRDTGEGIPEQDLQRIFDPFFTTKSEGEGTGLGLSVSYGIVAQHQGQITVDSEVGKGSMFIIRLPMLDLESEEEAEPLIERLSTVSHDIRQG